MSAQVLQEAWAVATASNSICDILGDFEKWLALVWARKQIRARAIQL
jgi:hypothetical protein